MGNRVFGRLAAVAAGGVLALTVTAPAQANDPFDLELHNPHQNTFVDDEEFGPHECAEGTEKLDERMAGKGDDEDGWHFVVAGGNIVSLTVLFAPDGDPDNASPVEYFGEPGDPDSPITFYQAGGNWRHAYVFTPAGWLLLTATATVTSGQNLVVSHTCPGEPGNGNGETPPPTTPPPGNGETPPPGNGETPPPGEEEPGLPVTGMQVGGLVALGVALLAAGAAMMVVRRRGSITDLAEEA